MNIRTLLTSMAVASMMSLAANAEAQQQVPSPNFSITMAPVQMTCPNPAGGTGEAVQLKFSATTQNCYSKFLVQSPSGRPIGICTDQFVLNGGGADYTLKPNGGQYCQGQGFGMQIGYS